LPREHLVAAVRQHAAVLLVPAAEALGSVVVALIVGGALANSLSLKVIIWVPAIFLVLQALWATVNWSAFYFVVTTERVLLIRGFGGRVVEMTPLIDLRNMRFEHISDSPWWTNYRAFSALPWPDYGAFYLGGGGRSQKLFDYVPYPEQLFLLISGLLFPSSVDEEERDPSANPVWDEL